MFFCKDKATKDSAPGAVIIHLLGGIHEIYFPYILMNPVIIVGPIVGNIAAIFWFTLTDCGLVGPASPGSIIAFLMMAPGSDIVKIIMRRTDSYRCFFCNLFGNAPDIQG